jgi:TatD DNase family protein
MIDSHCHLDAPDFDADRDQVLARAAASGVRALVDPGTDLASSRQAVGLAERYANVYAAVGVHPHAASSLDQATLAQVRQLASRAGVVAIGEIGLDYYRDLSPREEQRAAFEAQLALAADLDMPVIIHQRESAADVMAALRDWAEGGHPGCVLHAFSGDQAMADEAVALGFFLGIGGPLTFKNARSLPQIVTRVPLAHLVIETDAPYLAPHPFRGERNEPAYVVGVAECLAELVGLPLAQAVAQLTDNTRRLFRLPPPD